MVEELSFFEFVKKGNYIRVKGMASFDTYDKEIRIPVIENGEEVQIKVSLTAAKVNVERDGGVLDFTKKTETTAQTTSAAPQSFEPTEEEKNIVNDLISKLGL